jgi:hypothetical protein
MLFLPWKYVSKYFSFRHIPKLFYSYIGSEHKIKFSSSIASPFCYAIKLQVSLLLLPLSIYSKKRFGCSEKERERERENNNKIKERGQMSQHKRDF